MKIIGLTQRILYHKGRAYDSIEHGWYSFLFGHMLFYVPNILNIDFDYIADTIDILIITGGDDSTLRRTVETKLAAKMLERGKPILGICHGAFLLVDLLGGEVVEIEDHYDTEHDIYYFGDVHSVNSYHSLAIKKLHKTGTTLCNDADGNTEAFIDKNIAGVVWHPERMKEPWLPDEIQQLIWNT